jgi:hypothetical protein
MRGSRVAPKSKKATSERSTKLDDELRALLHVMFPETAASALLSLGQPALDSLLDAPDGLFFPTYMDWRDYGINRKHAIAAFAKADMDRVLSAMKKRKWTDLAVTLSGVGLVQDARVVPFLVNAYADPAPMRRERAIAYLGCQRDPRATETVLRALRDRSSEVRLTAIRALGQIGDLRTVEPVRAMANRYARSVLVKYEVKKALGNIRRANRTR